MAKHGRYKRKRRTASFAHLYKLVTFVVICAAIGVALAMFFKIETIAVSGNARYTAAQISEAGGVQTGDNMFLMNKYSVGENIRTTLPYIETVQIRRILPATLEIRVGECIAPAALSQEHTAYLLGTSGKIVDSVPIAKAKDYTQIIGVTLTEPTVGQPLRTDDTTGAVDETLFLLLQQLSSKEMLADTQWISLGEHSLIRLRYLDRFDVTFPRSSDIAYKLDYLLAVVDRLEANEKGEIDMTVDGKASFTPA